MSEVCIRRTIWLLHRQLALRLLQALPVLPLLAARLAQWLVGDGSGSHRAGSAGGGARPSRRLAVPLPSDLRRTFSNALDNATRFHNCCTQFRVSLRNTCYVQ